MILTQVMDYLNQLDHLAIDEDGVSPASRRDQMMALTRQHRLSAYDATYLELVLRLGATLATFDRRLLEAAHRAGGTVFRCLNDGPIAVSVI